MSVGEDYASRRARLSHARKIARQVARILKIPPATADAEAYELWVAKKRAEAINVVADELAPKVQR